MPPAGSKRTKERTPWSLRSFIKSSSLAIVQGIAELLPVSSSAHVIVAEKLMGLDPSSPEMTFLLAMLHTGTLFAVIVYFFWKSWKRRASSEARPAARDASLQDGHSHGMVTAWYSSTCHPEERSSREPS